MVAENPEDTDLQPETPPPAAGDVDADAVANASAPSLRETLEAAARDAGEPAQDGDRPRDASGRFLPKSADAAEGRSDAAAEKTASQPRSPTFPAATSDTPAAPSTAPAGPPPGWASEAKAVFTTLPPAVQQAVIKREQEVSAGFAQYAQAKQELERVIAPRRQHYAADGISDVQAIDNIWQWFEALKNSPAQAMPALAQMFGYDLSTVSPGADQSHSQVSPEVAALRAEVARLNGTVGQVTSTFEQQQTAARRAELDAFAKDKPHFERVRVTMGRLMQAGVAQGLDDAYQKAVALDPEATAAIAAEASRKAAEDALKVRGGNRHAAVSVRGGSPNGAAGSPVPTSIRDNLREGFASARGG